jgi:hypothetical protein
MKVPSTSTCSRQAVFRSPLHQFCCMMLEKYGNPNLISVEILAGEFIRFFNLPQYVCTEDIKALCAYAGVSTEAHEMPNELKGLNFAFEGELLIVYPESRWEGLQLMSLLHELREVMSRVFVELDKSITGPSDLESASEAFASAVVMQKPTFIGDVMHSSFNPILLQRKYQLSYNVILRRMVCVFDKALPMLISLFQNIKLLALSQSTSSWKEYMDKVKLVEEPEDPDNYSLTLSLQTSRFRSKECYTLYRGFVPNNDNSILSCQHALNVLDAGEHVLDQRAVLPGSSEYSEIKQAELISDGFLSTHAGVPANIILISIPECFRRKYDLKWVNPKRDPLMRNVETLGDIFGDAVQEAADNRSTQGNLFSDM